MKTFKTLLITLSLTLSFSAFSQNSSQPESPVDAVKTITTGKKKEARKKKAVMCEECGKPENECECDHKDEKGAKPVPIEDKKSK